MTGSDSGTFRRRFRDARGFNYGRTALSLVRHQTSWSSGRGLGLAGGDKVGCEAATCGRTTLERAELFA